MIQKQSSRALLKKTLPLVFSCKFYEILPLEDCFCGSIEACCNFQVAIHLLTLKHKSSRPELFCRKGVVTQSWVVKIIHDRKEKTTYKDHMLDEVNYLQKTSCTYNTPKLGNAPDYIGGIEKPLKATIISNMRSRFKVMEQSLHLLC